MTRRKFSCEFTIEAIRLVTERGVAVAQAARDLDVARSVLRRRMRELTATPAAAFPGNGQMRADLAEISALKKEVARLRAERDMPRRERRLFSHARRYEVRLHCQTPPHLAGQLALPYAGGDRVPDFTPGSAVRPVCARFMTPSPSRQSRRASRPATGPMVPAASGGMSWKKDWPAGFIGSNG